MRGGEGRKEGGIGLLRPLPSFSLFLPLSSTQREGKSYVRASEGGENNKPNYNLRVFLFSPSPPLLSIQPEFEKKPKYTCTSFALHDSSHNVTPDLPHPCNFSARCCRMMWSKLCLLGFDTFLGILK